MVTLACTGAPSQAQCSISPASITLDGSTSVNTAVSVSTTASSRVSHQGAPPSFFPQLRISPPMFWLLALLVLSTRAATMVRRPERGYARASSPVLVILLLIVMSMSCGGGGSKTVRNTGTPPGLYSLSVTGTLSTGSVNLQHKVDLKLTVN
jgi:large repetitive protein